MGTQTMNPREIKAELVRRGIKQRDIARAFGISPNAIWRIIARKSKSDRVQRQIASAIGRPFDEVWAPLPSPVHKSTTRKRAGNG